MKTILILILLLMVYSVTGCYMAGCDRVFPHLTWYWSAEAKRCRESRREEAAATKAWSAQQQQSTNKVMQVK